ncbi:MAG TPA: PCRF domain-containing protein, partial [Pyrinomonadaceae bacterium]|nr:PCRF domain-containing protein [Pyrinomonadaceae bacterium]
MLERLEQIEARYEELANELSAPELLADQTAYTKAARQHRTLGEIVEKFRTWKTLKAELEGAQELVEGADDDEMREMARSEVETLQQKLEATDKELKLLLVPSDPKDEKNVIVEIRAGAGGDEAAIFAADLFRMYIRYAEGKRWKTEIMSESSIGVGGYKEVIFEVKGKGTYSKLKYESGVHRVQRVPATEAQGRIHTSTATVTVLAEV